MVVTKLSQFSMKDQEQSWPLFCSHIHYTPWRFKNHSWVSIDSSIESIDI